MANFPRFMPFVAILGFSLFFSCTSTVYGTIDTPSATSDTFTDSRNNKDYKYVKIGNQVWMAENLNYNTSGSKCYNNDPANCNTYGRLYDWSTAMGFAESCNDSFCYEQIKQKNQGICPYGWHIPNEAEWVELINAVGVKETAGKKLKATSGWNDNGNGTDAYAFSALAGGYGLFGDRFLNVGNYGNWWSASESDTHSAYGRIMTKDEDGAYRINDSKSSFYSIRCVQD